MRLVINPNGFNNSKLPAIAAPGFLDTFERPYASVPGATSREGREWRASTNDNRPNVWGTNGDGEMELRSGAGRNILVADGLASNGTLQATLSYVNALGRAGLAFRVRDQENMYYLAQLTAGGGLRLQRRLNGTEVSIGSSTASPKSGDVYRVNMSGTSITVLLNGITVMSVEDSAHKDEQLHGLYCSTDSRLARFAEVSFAPD